MTAQPKTLSRSEQRPRIVNEAIQQLQLDRHPFAWLVADYSLTDASSVAQKVFNSSANGAIGVVKNTAYEIDALYLINVATSTPVSGGHTWGVLFGGTATISTAGTALFVEARSGFTSPLQAVNAVSIQGSSISSVTPVTATSTTTSESVAIRMMGRISIANAGTLIPQIQMSTTAGTGGTDKMQNGSFIRLHAIGRNNTSADGPWS
jgi:hypothetical protein